MYNYFNHDSYANYNQDFKQADYQAADFQAANYQAGNYKQEMKIEEIDKNKFFNNQCCHNFKPKCYEVPCWCVCQQRNFCNRKYYF